MDNDTPTLPHNPAEVARKGGFEDYAFQFITVTGGVLIALLTNGLVQWNSDRLLVREAHATIARELADDMNEAKLVMGSHASLMTNLDDAVQFANELLATQTLAKHSINLGFNLADLSTAAWDSAARTGALSHMDYADVQAYSSVYTRQNLFAVQQAKNMEHLTAALSLFSGGVDPAKARPDDVVHFRERVLLMKAGATVEAQLANGLIDGYGKVLARPQPR